MNFFFIIIITGFVGIAIFFLFSGDSTTNKSWGTINVDSLGLPVLGSLDSPITIIEFGNYDCSDCEEWHSTIMPLITENFIETNRANVVFVDSMISKTNMLASVATYCANEQQKYWEYHTALLWTSSDLNVKVLSKIARQIGLEIDSFEKCLEDRKYLTKVKYNSYESKKNGIKKLPTFILINNFGQYEKIIGLQSYAIFKEKLDALG